MIAISFSVASENPGLREQPGRLQIWLLGIGLPIAAATLATYLTRKRPHLLIVSGFAGALNPQIKVGEVFLCENFSDLKAVQKLQARGWIPPPLANLHTARQLVSTAKEKANLLQKTGKDLVDMETESLLEVARFHSIPTIIIRAVSDAAATSFPVPEHILYDKRRQRPRPIALSAYLVRNPQRIPAFVRMLGDLSKARAELEPHLRAAWQAAENTIPI